MNSVLAILTLLVVLITAGYSIRTLRIMGRKVSEVRNEQRNLLKTIERARKQSHRDAGIQLAKLNLLNLDIPGMRERNFDFILSLTSHPARFDALALALPELKKLVLQPREIVVNIARGDMHRLPETIRESAARGEIRVNECEDLGPGKKLIPTLKLYPDLPIIVIDDDLVLTPDLTLQLMLEHHLYPAAIIASRVHRVSYAQDGSLEPFSAWEKGADTLLGPSFDLMATSGAGTLFPAGSLHPDVLDEGRYSELTFHTDDLWWYFQGRRQGTQVRRLPGFRELEFIPETQDVGLWRTGNQEANDVNLKKLLEAVGLNNGKK